MKDVRAYLTCLPFLFLATNVFADITGTYACQEAINMVVKAGGKSTKRRIAETVTLNISADGALQMTSPMSPIPLRGSWTLSGRRFQLAFNQEDVMKNTLYGCELAGVDCTYIGSTQSFQLTANPNAGTLKGVGKSQFSFISNGLLINNSDVANISCQR